MKRIITFSILILTLSACSTKNNDLEKWRKTQLRNDSAIESMRKILEKQNELFKKTEKIQKMEREREEKRRKEIREELQRLQRRY